MSAATSGITSGEKYLATSRATGLANSVSKCFICFRGDTVETDETGCQAGGILALPSSPASGDGSSLMSKRPAGWPTITNRPANNLRVKREIWCTMGSA